MQFQNLTINSIEIERFKKIQSLSFSPCDGANLFFGSFRSGKTSLCEFIQFALYGADSVALARGGAEDSKGTLRVNADEKCFVIERSVIDGEEALSFSDENGPIETQLTPGEYLTGLDQDSFDQITYFRQARYEKAAFKPKKEFLRAIAVKDENLQDVYDNLDESRKEVALFHNAKGDGTLDALLKRRNDLKEKLDNRPALQEEAEQCANALTQINAKLDENDRRCVLLKADMAGHTDDVKLSRNKESAQELHRSIQATEKKIRLTNYDLTQKIGKLERAELEEMKSDYNRLSLAVTALNEARLSLSAAEENLLFHEQLFGENERLEHFVAEKKRIQKSMATRLILRILSVVLVSLGAGLFFVLRSLNFDFAVSLATGVAIGVLGIALFFLTSICTVNIRRILLSNGKESLAAFDEFLDRLRAHAKTTQVYRDQVAAQRAKCEKKTLDKENAQAVIFRKIEKLGYSQDDGELLAICDEIIEANDTLYDLEDALRHDQAQYQKLLTADLDSETLSVSPEFQALQKELSFLTAQNDSLFKKRAALNARIAQIKEQLNIQPEDLKGAITALDAEIEAVTPEYEAACARLAALQKSLSDFEENLKQLFAEKINEKLSFMLKEEESFLFDENFELCFCDRDSILPLSGAGGGMVSETGLLAFRLTLAEFLGKNALPMIFDDSLASVSPSAAGDLYQILRTSCSQFFVASSSHHILDLCSESAKVLTLS